MDSGINKVKHLAKMKKLKNTWFFIAELSLEFQDYGNLTGHDMDLIQKWKDDSEKYHEEIEKNG